MSLFECIEATLWRWRCQWAKRRADVRLAKRDRERSRDFYRRGVLVLALLCCPSLHACHGAERATRTALDVVAESVVAADAIVADGYSHAAQRELDASTSLDDYRARMQRWDRAEEALRAIVPALYAAQAGLDAAGAEGIRPALACVRVSVEQVIASLSAVDVPIPPSLSRAVDAAGLFTGECR